MSGADGALGGWREWGGRGVCLRWPVVRLMARCPQRGRLISSAHCGEATFLVAGNASLLQVELTFHASARFICNLALLQ